MNPHFEAPLTYYGAALDAARTVVILIHGRGQSPAYMEEHVVRRLDLPDVAYVAPTAAGNTWYPAGFMAPFADNEPHLGFALERVDALSNELAARGVPRASQVILGFSQGACLACEHQYRRQERVAALIAFTGGLIGPAGTVWQTPTRPYAGMPVLLGGGSADAWVPRERMIETAAVFRQLGAEVSIELYPSTAHEIVDDQIDAARAILLAQ
jgi:phospholipase/carboxylesterase